MSLRAMRWAFSGKPGIDVKRARFPDRRPCSARRPRRRSVGPVAARMPDCAVSRLLYYALPRHTLAGSPMPTAALAPLDETITIADPTRTPYPIYKGWSRKPPVWGLRWGGRPFLP